MRIPLTPVKTGIAMAVRVVPRGGGIGDDHVPVLETLVAFLADTFDRPRRDVTLISGHQSRTKRVAIAGLTEAQVAARLDVILSE